MEESNTNVVYHRFLEEILINGTERGSVRGQRHNTIELFGETSPMVFDLRRGIPVISTKKVWVKGIIEELLWFLRGDTNIRTLREKGVHIWDGNAYDFYKRNGGELSESEFFGLVDLGSLVTFKLKNEPDIEYYLGDLGRMYGYQLRRKEVSWNFSIKCTDPYAEVIDKLNTQPESRQIVLNMFSEFDTSISALPPCHTMPLIFNTNLIPTNVRIGIAEKKANEHIYNYNEQLLDDLNIPKYYLSAEMTQRSGDAFLGVPFNITSTALLINIIAQITNMVPYKMIHKVASAHIYTNHVEQVQQQIKRDTGVESYFPCYIIFGKDRLVPEGIKIDYSTPYGPIKADMVV